MLPSNGPPISKSSKLLIITNCRMLFLHYENVDIKFSAHNAFLEKPSSGKLKTERLESQVIFKVFGSNKTKEPKQDSQNQLRSPMPEGGEPINQLRSPMPDGGEPINQLRSPMPEGGEP